MTNPLRPVFERVGCLFEDGVISIKYVVWYKKS